MKRLGMFLLSIVMVAVPASAGDYYVDLFVGPNQTDDTRFAVLGTSTIATDFDTGLNFGASFGYDFDSQWRIEGELSARNADVDTHDLDAGGPIAGSFGEAKSMSIFANGFYDFDNKTRTTPYVGVGLGMVNVDYSGFGVPGLPALDDDDDVFGYQFVAGIAIKINDRWDFRTDFRMLQTDDASLVSSTATASTPSNVEYTTLDMTAGVRIKF
jgi:opacity protein-like surface antigen